MKPDKNTAAKKYINIWGRNIPSYASEVEQKARNTFDTAVGYGLTQFGEKAAADFYRQITDTEHLLAGHPHLGKTEPLLAHRKQEYRSLVVHQHYKIVYYIKGQTIRIVDLWDTRANPKRLTAHIR